MIRLQHWGETSVAGVGVGEWAKVTMVGFPGPAGPHHPSTFQGPSHDPRSNQDLRTQDKRQVIRSVLGRTALAQREVHTRSRCRLGEGRLGSRRPPVPTCRGCWEALHLLLGMGWVLPWQPEDPAPAPVLGRAG